MYGDGKIDVYQPRLIGAEDCFECCIELSHSLNLTPPWIRVKNCRQGLAEDLRVPEVIPVTAAGERGLRHAL
jgi:hypothetical protein